MGLAFHPFFEVTGLLYTFISETAKEAADFSILPTGAPADHQSAIREWRVSAPGNPNSVVDPASSRILLRIYKPQFNHNGGTLNFVVDGMLYIAAGDGGRADDHGVGHNNGGNG